MNNSLLKLSVFTREWSDRIQSVYDELKTLLDNQPEVKLLAPPLNPDSTPDSINADLLIVLGGDGAILHASRTLGRHQIPILGINLGRLGFLADLQPEDLRNNLQTICQQNFRVEEHLMFECVHRSADGIEHVYLGLNEVVAVSGASLRLIDIELLIDGDKVATFSGDGLIVSTPIGSTAHSLSAGGPILRQTLDAFVVTPICPHTLTNRPLVDSADCEYLMRFPKAPEGVMSIIDGQLQQPISPGDELVVRKAPVTFKLARFRDHSYYRTLHRKLGWGGQPRYQSENGS
ncbi:MAG: NAD(+)/NADH kinase [Planctomycetaceae bacterium]|nr:NAD(+)/NADH kinase [Planctomycetaceae bacterium]